MVRFWIIVGFKRLIAFPFTKELRSACCTKSEFFLAYLFRSAFDSSKPAQSP
jgi:hypothetical protein